MTIPVNDHYHLSELQSTDEAACVEHLQSIEIYNCTLRIPRPYSAESFRYWFNLVRQATQQQGTGTTWAIRNSDEYLVGAIGFLDVLQIGKSHRAEIGYWLAKPYWGRGIMTQVVSTLCKYAFSELLLVKISAEVFAGNDRSARVLEKCGFVQEGFLRRHYLKDGKLIDARVFARFKE